MELDTVGMVKQIRQRINHHMADRPFNVEHVQTEVLGDTQEDELLRIRVWVTENGGNVPREYKRDPCSEEWNALKRLVKQILDDPQLDDSVGAGTVSATRNHMQIVYPQENYETGQFRR